MEIKFGNPQFRNLGLGVAGRQRSEPPDCRLDLRCKYGSSMRQLGDCLYPISPAGA